MSKLRVQIETDYSTILDVSVKEYTEDVAEVIRAEVLKILAQAAATQKAQDERLYREGGEDGTATDNTDLR